MTNSLVITITSNPKAVFYPNQVVEGTVQLTINQVVKARGLRLVVKGKAECKWSRPRGNSSTSYFGRQKYLESVNYLFGSEDGDPTDVPVGVYTYNFACQLPEEIPYSVEGAFAFIRYKVDANLDIPWDLDLRSVRPFTVVRHDDLNLVTFPDYRQPCEAEAIKTFCCLFCESDPVIVTMRLPKTGFGLGETIPIYVKLVNKSTTNIMSSEFQLIRVEEYTVSEPVTKTRTTSSNVLSKTTQGVGRLQSKELNANLTIPRVLTTSNDRFCSIFEIKYYVRFKAYPQGMNVSFDVEALITIGNVGISDEESGSSLVPAIVQGLNVNAHSRPSFVDLPPSFEEATGHKTKNAEEEDLF